MAPRYVFSLPDIKTYSEQLYECADRCQFNLTSKHVTKKENAGYYGHGSEKRSAHSHQLYLVNGTSYTQYKGVSTSKLKDAKNEAAGLIIGSGILKLAGRP
ncbi:hypothetical protein AG1IA_03526 [Rhizoctonia solani AG-1 IA]|uniref:DRBM domain-containing protein n=1 Tax=Thanatephorus cucumeris (strain AG1-IA) TaxID=983506 RepID=L8X033_THACA|nr:hypothetical protein AG1IA_03526 [Rhizoctonia solani AG-1 IA]